MRKSSADETKAAASQGTALRPEEVLRELERLIKDKGKFEERSLKAEEIREILSREIKQRVRRVKNHVRPAITDERCWSHRVNLPFSTDAIELGDIENYVAESKLNLSDFARL